MEESIKAKAFKGVFWSFCERFGSLLILFIANIVLARELSPEDFGLVGMLMVFILLSQILVDGGLGNALIQKKDVTQVDCSTVFYSNIAVAAVCYAVLYFAADAIAGFYSQPQLVEMIRVLGLVVVFDALGAVQNNLLMRDINFKLVAVVKVGAALVSTVVAIVSAYCGLGVWSLVIQYLVNSVIKSLLLWITATWYPAIEFSFRSFKTLFGFGSKLLIACLLSEGYRHLQVMIIGKFFPAKEVGYYTQAKHLQDVPITTILTIVNQVTFPVFSKLQDNKEKLVSGLRRSLKILTFINFPVMACLVVIAQPVFLLLFGEKWLMSVPYFQWLCGGFGFLLVIHNTNLNSLKAIGKSDIVLYLEIIKKVLGLGMIFGFLAMGYGAMSIMWALAINSVIEFFLNGYYTGKHVGYGIIKQARDILPNFAITVIAGVVSYLLPQVIDMHYLAMMVVQILCFATIYLMFMKMFKVESFEYLITELKTRIKK